MKISALPLEEVLNQLQILEYIETNTTEGLTEGDRTFRAKLQKREKHLRETVSASKQHPLRDKLESAARGSITSLTRFPVMKSGASKQRFSRRHARSRRR